MSETLSEDDFSKLCQELVEFRVPKSHRGDATQNEFWGLTEADIAAAEAEMGLSLPTQLRTFYQRVGHGHLVKDRNENWQPDYLNIFVDLKRLRDLWLRTDVSFQYDPELVEKGELPFFDMGSHSYFVLRPYTETPNAVFAPYDRKPIAPSIADFVSRLYSNTTFFLSHEGEYGT